MKKREKYLFFATIGLILVILACMVGHNFLSFRKSLLQDIVQIGTNTIAADVNEIEAYMGVGTTTLKNAATSVDYMLANKKSTKEIDAYLEVQTKAFQETIDANFTGVYGYVDGDYVDGSDWVPDADYVPTERDWYIAAIEANGETVVIPPYVDAMTNEVIVSVCCMLEDGKSVLSLDIVLNNIQLATEGWNEDNGELGQTFILDAEGVAIAHSDKSIVGTAYKTENVDTAALYEVAVPNIEIGEFGGSEIKYANENAYVFYGKTADGWTVVRLSNAKELLAPVSHIFVRNSVVVVIVYILIIIISFLAYKQLAAAIEALNKNKEQIKRTNENIKRSNTAVTTMAYTNIITELKNRFALQTDMEEIYQGHKLTIAYFDIDNFGDINARYGFGFGDALLSEVATKIKPKASEKAVLYNIYGDDFCIVFDRDNLALSDEYINNAVDAVFRLMNNAYVLDDVTIPLKTSALVFDIPANDATSEEVILLNATERMKDIKKAGGGIQRF